MLGSEIKLLIVDFDGTLVDTFRANFMAYQELIFVMKRSL